MRVIDAHTHIFPDKIARKATVATADYFDLPEPPNHYGSVQELLDVLHEAGIGHAMVFSAATTAAQVEHINRYILQEAEAHPEFIPCGTLHAEYENFEEELAWMRAHGIYGIKLHPEFQHFVLDDRRLFPMFEEMAAHDMFLISHMGTPVFVSPARNGCCPSRGPSPSCGASPPTWGTGGVGPGADPTLGGAAQCVRGHQQLLQLRAGGPAAV